MGTPLGNRNERRHINWDNMTDAMKVEGLHLDLGVLSAKLTTLETKVKEIDRDVNAIKSLSPGLQALLQAINVRSDGIVELSTSLHVKNGADILLD